MARSRTSKAGIAPGPPGFSRFPRLRSPDWAVQGDAARCGQFHLFKVSAVNPGPAQAAAAQHDPPPPPAPPPPPWKEPRAAKTRHAITVPYRQPIGQAGRLSDHGPPPANLPGNRGARVSAQRTMAQINASHAGGGSRRLVVKIIDG